MKIDFDIQVSKEQFYETLRVTGIDIKEVDKLWLEYSTEFRQTLKPSKYNGSTLKGELINSMVADPLNDEVIIMTNNFKETYYCEINECFNADYLLCQLQGETDINVSKY